MKTFFSALCAILVAAAILYVIASVSSNGNVRARTNERTRQIQLQSDSEHEQMLWSAEMSRTHNQIDPSGEKLTARLIEIKEASEAGKPIPPSPFLPPSN